MVRFQRWDLCLLFAFNPVSKNRRLGAFVRTRNRSTLQRPIRTFFHFAIFTANLNHAVPLCEGSTGTVRTKQSL